MKQFYVLSMESIKHLSMAMNSNTITCKDDISFFSHGLRQKKNNCFTFFCSVGEMFYFCFFAAVFVACMNYEL